MWVLSIESLRGARTIDHKRSAIVGMCLGGNRVINAVAAPAQLAREDSLPQLKSPDHLRVSAAMVRCQQRPLSVTQCAPGVINSADSTQSLPVRITCQCSSLLMSAAIVGSQQRHHLVSDYTRADLTFNHAGHRGRKQHMF